MNLYTITFIDGTQVAINALTSDDAIRKAQDVNNEPVASFSLEKTVEKQPLSSFESMKHGGPNL